MAKGNTADILAEFLSEKLSQKVVERVFGAASPSKRKRIFTGLKKVHRAVALPVEDIKEKMNAENK